MWPRKAKHQGRRRPGYVADGGVQRRGHRHRHHPARPGGGGPASRFAPGAVPARLAVLSGLCRQLRDHRRGMDQPSRPHRTPRAGRPRPAPPEPPVPAAHRVPSVPDPDGGRLPERRRRRRAGGGHRLRAHPAGHPVGVLRHGRLHTDASIWCLPGWATPTCRRPAGSSVWPSSAYGLGIVVGLLVPVVAIALYFGIALFLVLPFHAIGHALRGTTPT